MIKKTITAYRHWRRGIKIRREKPQVWLIEKRKLGYIQIPKVATRSVQVCLSRYYAELNDKPLPEEWTKEAIRHIESQTTYHLSHEKISNLTDEYFIFGFVRNPYDRLYSAYKNKVIQPLSRTAGRSIFENHGIELGISFKQFVDIVISIPDENIDRHLRSQSWFLTYKGKLIPKYIGHLEFFDNDWAKLDKEFKLGSPPHKNSTVNLDKENFRHQYDAELEEKVFNRYKNDFELFGYNRLNSTEVGSD